MGAAIQRAAEMFKDPNSGGREGAKRMVILLTNGYHDKAINPIKAAGVLRTTHKVTVVTIGYGYAVRYKTLRRIASTRRHFLRIQGHYFLLRMLRFLGKGMILVDLYSPGEGGGGGGTYMVK